MSKPLPLNLPDDVARVAAAQVAAGHFPSVEAVVRAGVRAIERDNAQLEAIRAALLEGEESGLCEGDPFASVRAELGLPRR
jgi:antitoxin ParD1/3/4